MHRFATVPAVLLCLATVGTAAALTAPEQTHAAGLDFWHANDEAAQLRAETEQRRDLEFEHEQLRHRNAAGQQIALSLCEDRIGAREALDAIAALAEISPDWFAQLRVHYRSSVWGTPAATDLEVKARYLRVKIEQMIRTAEISGDAPRVAFLSARLTRFDNEVRRSCFSSAPQTK
jgi:hypothetical protein